MKNLKQFAVIAILSFVVISCCDCPKGNLEAILISSEEAIELEKNYVENQYELISQTYGEDSREVLFTDINALRAFLIKIQEEGEERGLENLGVRIFLGAKKEDGVSRTTVFLTGVAAPNENPNPLDDPTDPYPLSEDYLSMAIFANKGSMGNNNLIPIESELINP